MGLKYQEVTESLAAEIAGGKYGPGDKLPSEAALVNKFKTSRITVGRAFRELQNRGLIDRVAGSGSYVRAQPEALASMMFGLLIPDLGETEIFEPICQGIANAPEAAAHALLWGHADVARSSKEQQAWQLCLQFITRKVSGVFFAPLEFETGAEDANRQILAELKKERVPVVLLDRRPSGMAERGRPDLVGINNRQAGYAATEHLIKLGCKNIGFLGYHAAASTISSRLAGYHEALQTHGLAVHTDEVLYGGRDGDGLDHNVEAHGLEAFVCVNDRIAGQLMHSLLVQGVKIPADLRIVGIDDVGYAALLPVPLTTVRQPCHEIGRAALRTMLERIERPKMPPRDVLLDGELIVRRSSGARREV